METKSFGILLSLLEMGQQTGTFRLESAAVTPLSSSSMREYSGYDLASLPSWYALLVVQNGQVQRCGVFDANGRLMLQGRDALEQLDRVHPIRYNLYDPSPTALLLPGPPLSAPTEGARAPSSIEPGPGNWGSSPGAAPAVSRPRFGQLCPNLTPLGKTILQQSSTLTRYQGSILRLCDGKRTILRIAQLLRIIEPAEQEDLVQTIQAFAQRGYLDFTS